MALSGGAGCGIRMTLAHGHADTFIFSVQFFE
jgi:hypothetical protein